MFIRLFCFRCQNCDVWTARVKNQLWEIEQKCFQFSPHCFIDYSASGRMSDTESGHLNIRVKNQFWDIDKKCFQFSPHCLIIYQVETSDTKPWRLSIRVKNQFQLSIMRNHVSNTWLCSRVQRAGSVTVDGIDKYYN